jgi:hypothetical protein
VRRNRSRNNDAPRDLCVFEKKSGVAAVAGSLLLLFVCLLFCCLSSYRYQQFQWIGGSSFLSLLYTDGESRVDDGQWGCFLFLENRLWSRTYMLFLGRRRRRSKQTETGSTNTTPAPTTSPRRIMIAGNWQTSSYYRRNLCCPTRGRDEAPRRRILVSTIPHPHYHHPHHEEEHVRTGKYVLAGARIVRVRQAGLQTDSYW